jgi:hypothetical protein
VLPTEQIRPLHDVWLRPRRVFRELASRPVGRVDYLLGAAQGIAVCLSLSRTENAGASLGLIEIFLRALVIGSIGGTAGLFLMSLIYTRLGTRLGGGATRSQVFHVLAYGNVPLAASLIVWIFAALLTGEIAFQQTPHGDVEGFVALLVRIQFITSGVLQLWSVIIQVMGLSEIQGLTTWRAFGLWVLGQLIGVLTVLFLLILLVTLFPGAVPG